MAAENIVYIRNFPIFHDMKTDYFDVQKQQKHWGQIEFMKDPKTTKYNGDAYITFKTHAEAVKYMENPIW